MVKKFDYAIKGNSLQIRRDGDDVKYKFLVGGVQSV